MRKRKITRGQSILTRKKYLVHFGKLDIGQKGFLTGVDPDLHDEVAFASRCTWENMGSV